MRHRQLMAAVALIPTLLFAEAKVFCSSSDAYDARGRQSFSGADAPAAGGISYIWKIDGMQPGNVAVSIEYACGPDSGAEVELRLDGQVRRAVIGPSGAHIRSTDREIIQRLNQEIGTFTIDKSGPQTLQMSVLSGSGSPFFSFHGLTLEGRPLFGAQVDASDYSSKKRPSVAVKDEKVEHNTLSKEDSKAGWKLLFNGKDLSGWYGFHLDAMPPGWTVDGGALHAPEGAECIMTFGEFKDFELMIDWKVGPDADGGILLRAVESAKEHPADRALEIRVRDHMSSEDGPLGTAGAVNGLLPLKHSPANAVGDWNTSRIIVQAMRYQVYLNDVLTADFTVGSDEWYDALYDSDCWRLPGLGDNPQGAVGLRGGTGPVWYRNIRIRPL